MAASSTKIKKKIPMDIVVDKLLKTGVFQVETLPENFPVDIEQAKDPPPASLTKQLPASNQVTPSVEAVLAAIQNSDLATIKETCEAYNRSFPNPVSKIHTDWNEFKQTPLHVAVARRDLSILEYLLGCQGFQTELIERRFWNIVHTSVQNTRHFNDDSVKQTVAVLKHLAQQNPAILNVENDDGIVPFLLPDAHATLVIDMASLGCDLSVASDDPLTPTVFHLAATYFTPSQFADLVKTTKAEDLKTCFSKVDSFRRSPLHVAVANFEVEEVTLDALTGSVDFNTLDVENQTVFHQAVEGGRSVNFLESLVKRGATAGATIFEGNNVIHCAVAKGSGAATVEFLCKSFSQQVNQKNKTGQTPLSMALVTENKESLEIVRVLVTIGGLKADQYPHLELSQMKCADRWQVFKFLLRHGFSVDPERNNVLHRAPEHVTLEEFHDVVQEFVNSGKKEYISAPNKRNQRPLHLAVLHLDVMESTLNLFPEDDFRAVDAEGNSVLFAAIQGGRDVKFIQSLLKRGAEVQKVNAGGNNIIHWSVQHANMATTKYLGRRFRSLLNQKNKDGLTALQLLLKCEHASLEWVKLLVEQGEDVKLIPYMEVLQMAGRDKLKVLEFLEEKGLRIFDVDPLGNNLLHLAPACLNPEEYHALIEICFKRGYQYYISTKNNAGCLPMHLAVKHLELEEHTFNIFNARNTITSAVDSNNMSVLFYAVEGNRSEKFLKMLVARGLDPLKVVSEGLNILQLAVKNGSENSVKYFAKELVDLVDTPNEEGLTPLKLALQENRDMKGVVEALLKAGAKMEEIQPTSLLKEVKCKDKWDVVTAFIRSGYKIEDVDGKGNNLLHFATDCLSPDEFHCLALSFVDADKSQAFQATDGSGRALSVLHRVLHTMNPRRETLQLFKEHGVDFNYRYVYAGKPYYSPIYEALSYGRSLECLKQLVEFGADCSLARYDGYSPLHYAAYCCADDVVELILEIGGDANAGHNKMSPLHYAVQYPNNDASKRFKTAELLISKGANVNAENNEGLTPLEYAIQRGVAGKATFDLLKKHAEESVAT